MKFYPHATDQILHFTIAKRDPWIDLGFWALGGLAASLLLA